jgi:hypothetical protein
MGIGHINSKFKIQNSKFLGIGHGNIDFDKLRLM